MNRILLAGATCAALLAATLTVADPASATDAPQQYTQHVAASVGAQTWTVPNGTHTVTITAVGAAGGRGDDAALSGASGANGGYGAVVTETFVVQPGYVLGLYPGGAGAGDRATGSAPWSNANGGYGGYSDGPHLDHGGGGGGSATDVTVNGQLVAVAGGGGGGGAGGAVAGETGGSGGDAGYPGSGGNGYGAGSGGSGLVTGTSSYEYGGSALDAPGVTSAGGGGGGGAGWNGYSSTGGSAGSSGRTGGGGGGGGAGGASYASALGAGFGLAGSRGDGYVDLTWSQGITTTTTLTANPTSASGQPDTITASVTADFPLGQPGYSGTVTFIDFQPFADAPTVLGTVPVGPDGTATWSADNFLLGTHGLRAVYSGDANFVSSSSTFLYQTVTAPLGAAFSVSPLAFGSTVLGVTRTKTVTMTNTNAVPTKLRFVGTSNPDIQPTGTCLTTPTLAPGASCTWVVTLKPSVLGADNATITVVLGATANPSFLVTGNGVSALRPVVTGVSPNSGPAAGGTLITITGNNLSAATRITVGGVLLTSVQCASSSRCTGRTPAGHVTVDVRITTAGGTSATGTADRFTYAR